MSNTQLHTSQKQCHLSLIFQRHLPTSNIIVLSNPNMQYELTTTKEEGTHFILSDNNNYDFNVKIGHYGLVGFVKTVIDCGCLRCVFCFRIKEKEEDTFYINFYFTIFP